MHMNTRILMQSSYMYNNQGMSILIDQVWNTLYDQGTLESVPIQLRDNHFPYLPNWSLYNYLHSIPDF
jgi:hypothetical protein